MWANKDVDAPPGMRYLWAMARSSGTTAAARQRDRAQKAKRQEKLRRRQERKEQSSTQPKSDGLEGIRPGPQPIPWEEYGLAPPEVKKEKEEDEGQNG